MKPWTLAGSTAIIALLATNTALADVTPEEVWQTWQDFYATTGNKVTTGSAARDGDTFVITDFKATSDNTTMKSETAIAEIRLRDLGDGTVEMTMSDEMTYSTTGVGTEGEPATGGNGVIKMPGQIGTVSGTVDDMAYSFVTPTMDMQLELTEDGTAAGTIGVLLANSTTRYQISGPADAKEMEGSFVAASAAINLDVPAETGGFAGTLNAADLSGKIMGNLVGAEEPEISDALAKGFAIDTQMSYGALNYDFDVTDPTSPAKLSGGSEGGSFQMVMDAAKMMLAGGGKNVAVTFSSAELPFPEVKLSYAESGFNLTMPIGASDTPKDFAFLTKIVDLQVSDEIWGMFDPSGALPHDPATLIIDTKGTAKMNADLMATAEGAEPDGELHSLDVTQLQAKFAGAELTGNGAFTFDNSDLTTFDGMPAPTGKLDLKLVGGNALLDKLQTMGLVSEDDAMGARMMIAMFANPGAGEDELVSEVEMKDKHLFVNGQQLQ